MIKLNEYKSNEQIIEMLENDGITVDIEKDMAFLNSYGVVGLIYNFGHLLQKHGEKTKLSDIYGLLNFEIELSQVIMKNISKFEYIFRKALGDVLAKHGGPFAHHKKACFNLLEQKKFLSAKEMIYKVESFQCQKTEYKSFLVDHRVPIWLIVHDFDMGQLKTLFASLKKEFKEECISLMTNGSKDIRSFEERVMVIKHFRNRISHNRTIHEPYIKPNKETKIEKKIWLNTCIESLVFFEGTKNIKTEIVALTKTENTFDAVKIRWLEEFYKTRLNKERSETVLSEFYTKPSEEEVQLQAESVGVSTGEVKDE